MEEILDLLKHIKELGYQGYIVGGYVRDHLLGLEVYDGDLCSTMTPSEVNEHFEVVSNAGEKFGCIVIKYNNQEFELTTLRKDEYTKSRFPQVSFVKTINEDVVRRDFTINALYMNELGEVIDLVNGQEDLRNKKLRFIGDAKTRIEEDPLRITRAVRFAAKLDFEIVDWDVILENINLLSSINSNRLKKEFDKLENNLENKYVVQYLSQLEKLNIK